MMKNTIKTLVILLAAFTFQSCSKDDDPIQENPVSDAYYKVFIDGTLFSEASDDVLKDAFIVDGSLTCSNDPNDFMIIIYNVPEIGETVIVDLEAWAIAVDNGDNSLPYVKIAGTNVNGGNNEAIMFSGTLTRESKYKVTFDGFYYELTVGGSSHDYNGEIVVETVVNF